MATKIYKYEVRGRFQFPVDMLRYDCCWPQTQNDVAEIVNSMSDGLRDGGFHVLLTGVVHPSKERWESFGYQVSPTILTSRVDY